MGTRSLTVIKDGKKEICVLYRQHDGYPEGHGKELAEFLSGFTVVNGYCSDDEVKVANGAGCLAAQIISHFKTGVGQFYLYPPKTRYMGEEYVYEVSVVKGNIEVTVNEVPYPPAALKVLFFGTPEECLDCIKASEVENA